MASLTGSEYEAREEEIEDIGRQITGQAPLTSERARSIKASMDAALAAEPRDLDDPGDIY